MSSPISPPEMDAPSAPGTSPKAEFVDWFALRAQVVRGWLYHRFGIDRAIAFTLVARGWSSLAGLVTVFLIARYMAPAEQGYYYTFGSLVALELIFELGFSFVILQMASHERAHLTVSSQGEISGPSVAHDRLASVLQKTVRWYTSLAILLAVFLLIAGSYFFSAHHQPDAAAHWKVPWYAVVLATALAFQIDPILSFMEGCGYVSNVALVRFVQSVIANAMAWLAFTTHRGLFAPAVEIAFMVAISLVWLFLHRRLLLSLLRRNPGNHRISWMKEVWGFQWRIAVSYLCGYFIFQLYNPVLFAYRGAVVAGQMGMSLGVMNALQAIGMTWISTKVAPFGSMIARKEFALLDRVFFRALKQAFAVTAAVGLVVWLGDLFLNWAHVPLAQRLLDPLTLGILLTTPLINVVIFAEALYLRAHKVEKFLLNSVIGAILMTACIFILGRSYGALGIVIGSWLIGLLMGLPFGTYTFAKYRRLWHVE